MTSSASAGEKKRMDANRATTNGREACAPRRANFDFIELSTHALTTLRTGRHQHSGTDRWLRFDMKMVNEVRTESFARRRN